jgi:hypothetical protein
MRKRKLAFQTACFLSALALGSPLTAGFGANSCEGLADLGSVPDQALFIVTKAKGAGKLIPLAPSSRGSVNAGDQLTTGTSVIRSRSSGNLELLFVLQRPGTAEFKRQGALVIQSIDFNGTVDKPTTVNAKRDLHAVDCPRRGSTYSAFDELVNADEYRNFHLGGAPSRQTSRFHAAYQGWNGACQHTASRAKTAPNAAEFLFFDTDRQSAYGRINEGAWARAFSGVTDIASNAKPNLGPTPAIAATRVVYNVRVSFYQDKNATTQCVRIPLPVQNGNFTRVEITELEDKDSSAFYRSKRGAWDIQWQWEGQ